MVTDQNYVGSASIGVMFPLLITGLFSCKHFQTTMVLASVGDDFVGFIKF